MAWNKWVSLGVIFTPFIPGRWPLFSKFWAKFLIIPTKPECFGAFLEGFPHCSPASGVMTRQKIRSPEFAQGRGFHPSRSMDHLPPKIWLPLYSFVEKKLGIWNFPYSTLFGRVKITTFTLLSSVPSCTCGRNDLHPCIWQDLGIPL